MIRRAVAFFSGIVLLPSLLLAGPTIPGFYGTITPSLPAIGANTVPHVLPGGVMWGAAVSQPAVNQVVVNQTQPKAVIDWKDFNIGSNASVTFNQQGNTSWAALNRIWDLSPSQIYGSLKADGQVYLINQNGILFGPGSQVNVHTLIASSLNLNVDTWINSGTLAFNTNQGTINGQSDLFYNPGQTPGVVSNTGTIQTDNQGSVFLIGPQVENSGTIISPSGQIGLVAGTDLELDLPPINAYGSPNPYAGSNDARTTLVVKVNSSPQGSVASNMEGGLLAADTGLVGMYGRIVNQDGIIRSVTAVKTGGHVELFASDTISTGPNSLISLPVSTSAEAVSTTFQTAQSTVLFSGLDPNNPWQPTTSPNLIVHQGAIIAPSGNVMMNAVSRVYMDSGSLIDVSGLWIDKSADSGLLQVQMNTYNLRDDYAQKGGVLQGQTIKINALSGSSIGDVSSAYSSDSLTAAERHTAGGTVFINVAGGSGTGASAAPGDIILRTGALINFSGGGTTYGAGTLDTTKLVLGNRIYDISTADSSLHYDSILNVQTFTNSRFNITEQYNGLFYGGASPVKQYVQAYTVGDDAGSLSLMGGQVVLDGSILGGVTKGLQQTWSPMTMPTVLDPKSETVNREPIGGKLTIGNAEVQNNGSTGDTVDFFTREIVVSPQTSPLPQGFQPTDPLPSSRTVLSAAILNNAGLSFLGLAANTSITVEKGAQINLIPAGTFRTSTDSTGQVVNAIENGGFGAVFTARAGRIVNYGDINVPGGAINLSIETNVTSNPAIASGPNPDYVPLDQRIYLAPGSSLNARGENIDNTASALLSAGTTPIGHLNGGSVNLLDETVTGQGVVVSQGALIDVSGGWYIDTTGKVTGGDAGSVTLQGPSLILGGDLRAWSLVGSKGGTISMHAANVTIAASPAAAPSFGEDDPWPDSFQGKMVIGSSQLAGTGFSAVTIKSVNDIVMEGGAAIGPSLTKLAAPLSASATSATQVNRVLTSAAGDSLVIQATQDDIGTSSVTMTAGTTPSNLAWGVANPNGNGLLSPSTPNLLARIQLSPGASVRTGPQGALTMSAPYIDIAGLVSAPSGTVSVKAGMNLLVEGGASILAEGYNKPGTSAPFKGLAVEATPLAGGTVNLTAAGGDLILSPGSLVSVSGSSPVQQTVVAADGTVSSATNAGTPGTISLSAMGTMQWAGDLTAQARIEGLAGGTLSLAKTDPTGTLSLAAGDLARFRDSGFDAINLSSAGTLGLQGSGQVAFGRSLTLSAPVITGSGSDMIALSAPWVQVTNTALPSSSPPVNGSAAITLAGTWLDVSGAVLFSGFRNVTLEAARDIRLADLQYMYSSQDYEWHGLLATAGDVTLQAARVYPTTLSGFTIDTTGAPAPYGKVTILPSGMSAAGPIYSAGGSLTINAAGGYRNGVPYGGIDQEGYLAAPMGNITMNAANGRVYLAPGSVTTTRGSVTAANEDLPVLYGTADAGLGDNVWGITDKTLAQKTNSVAYAAVTGVPGKSVSVNGAEVIVASGATLDVSGGGSVFTYQFLPSYSGTNNPLTAANTYVILPDNSVVLPGNGVYLSGIQGLRAGTYSLLPAQYAFLPGAMVITDLATTLATSKATLTKDGYPIVGGYATTMGTGIRSPQLEAYEVRPASVVLAQGDFEQQTYQAGAAGSVTLAGTTTILNGAIQASSAPGFPGGSIALSGTGTNLTVQASTIPLPPGFGFGTPIAGNPDPNIGGLAGTLNIAAPSLSGKGFQTIGLGVSDLSGSAKSATASTVDIGPGVVLQAENIILGATSTANGRNAITLEPGAQVLAIALPGDTGQATFISPGTLSIGANAVVHASNGVNLQTANTVFDPTATLKADHSFLNLQNSAITLYDPAVTSRPSGSGLFLTVGQWNNFSAAFDNITLTSLSDLVFDGSFAPGALGAVANVLTIDAGRIMDSVANGSVFLAAQTIGLQNTTGASKGPGAAAGASQIAFTASQIQVNQGNVLFDGFSNVNLNGLSNVTFSGVGSLTTGGGNLTVSTPRVATSYATPAGVYMAANYAINAGIGNVIMQGNGAASASTAAPGGTLAVTAGEIDISTIVEVPSGQIELTATGNINLGSGGRLLSRGTDYAPGGVVSMTSTNGGGVTLMAGSLIDVSAGTQGDAGTVNLYAPAGGVALNGAMLGLAAGGKGGSLSMITHSLDTTNGINGFSALNNALAAGGFNETVTIEANAGDITIPVGETVRARSLKITADAGSIDLSGVIDVSQTDHGGTVEMYAKNDLSVTYSSQNLPQGGILEGGVILAKGTGTNAAGGEVTLGADAGELSLYNGVIDVSGTGASSGGTVTFRNTVPPPGGSSNWQVRMSLIGTVTGASSVVAEADRIYYVNGSSAISYTPVTNQNSTITQATINGIYADVSTFMNSSGSLKTQLMSGLAGVDASLFHLRPGVVIEQTTGDLTLSQAWNLASLTQNWHFAGEPGTLTLRAAGNLNVSGNITDSPTSNYITLSSSDAQPSWGINLVAGALTQSPDLLAVKPAYVQGATAGNLTISPNDVVYTETGAIRFASGGNTIINQSPTTNSYMITSGMKYSLGTYTGSIRGDVAGGLTINAGSAIQSATGNIDLSIGGDLSLGSSTTDIGTIRTTGEHALGMPYNIYSSYAGGGSIFLDVAGAVAPGLYAASRNVGSADWLTTSGAYDPVSGRSYKVPIPMYGSTSTEGIVTMAGGDLYVRAGGGFNGQAGTFGAGDLRIYSGGDINGRFLVHGNASSASPGIADISAMGNFGDPGHTQLIEASNAQVRVSAQGEIDLGAFVNPALLTTTDSYWNNQYTAASSLTLSAVTGDVNMYASIDTSRYGRNYAGITIAGYTNTRMTLLPPSLTVAAGRDINIYSQYVLLPATNGGLSMTAGNDIIFHSTASTILSMAVSDFDPSVVYGLQILGSGGIASTVAMMSDLATSHASLSTGALHSGDGTPVIVSAGGNITDMTLTVPKMANISAGGDIVDLNYSGQNVNPGDVTSIRASGNILYGYVLNAASERIQVGGPGYLVVQAGGRIDLGNTVGIQTIGNGQNPALSGSGSSLIVAAGLSGGLSLEQLGSFGDSLHQTAIDNKTFQEAGDTADAQRVISDERTNVIWPLVRSYGTNGGGGITMTSSQISTTGGGSILVATSGTVDVGKTVIDSGQKTNPDGTPKQTGIFTAAGGGITVFADSDVNVNESRIMTFRGGDITVWSDHGGINAGTGSKAAINMAPPLWTKDPNTGLPIQIFQPPAIGSGIRGLTSTSNINDAGDVYLIAPEGIINAGEAGISGRSVDVFGTVVNAANISSASGSVVGAPTASQGVSLGALTGATSLGEKSGVSQDQGAIASSQGKAGSAQAIEDFVKWVDVKVIGYDLSYGVAGGPEAGQLP